MDTATLLAFGAAFFSGALAFYVGWSERRSPARLAFVIGMALLAAESVFNGLSLHAATLGETAEWQNCGSLSMCLLPGVWLFFSLAYGRGSYREFLLKWRPALAAIFLTSAVIGAFLLENLIAPAEGQFAQIPRAGSVHVLLNFLFVVGAVLVLMNFERTFRAAVGTMRWRIKFMVLGLGVFFAVRLFTSTLVLLFHATNPAWQTLNAGALLLACALILRSLVRTGHFDTSIYPSHSLLQGSITALLAGIYLAVIGVFAKTVTFGGGEAAFTLKAFAVLVALVLLAMFLLSDRVRLQTRRFVSRHFQRPLYDYRTVWRKFTEGTGLCVNQNELCDASLKLLTDVFQCLSVTIWLVDDKRENLTFAASTCLTETQASLLNLKSPALTEALATLQKHPGPIDLDACKQSWAGVLRQCHPGEFDRGGNCVCLPLVAGGELLGLTLLGDRVGGLPFSWQDFDLLKCVGDQMAASLSNLRLSQKLLQARELEAFQTMSTFFVHDLKNAAAALSLMLQNLPLHFDDPAFREDALRGTSKSVAHINRLIERLGQLRHELKIKPVEADLNVVVTRALAGWESVGGVNLIKELRPLPRTFFDAEQVLKVVTNLVLNAREAVLGNGHVRVETSELVGWAVLSVSDTGCGMKPEFLNHSLFRPFQTTKKNGLGIGMFQSKMIVEAHRGRIEVESEPEKGTTFRVLLPLMR